MFTCVKILRNNIYAIYAIHASRYRSYTQPETRTNQPSIPGIKKDYIKKIFRHFKFPFKMQKIILSNQKIKRRLEKRT